MRIAIRGFAGRKKQFEDIIDEDADHLGALVPELAEKHAKALAAHEIHMIEIEFLDDPGEERFFRFGTDPQGMLCPIRVKFPPASA